MDETTRQHIGAIIVIGLLLTPWTLIIPATIFYAIRERYLEWRDKRIDAKIDKLFKEHDKRRASSSTCAEHLALNQEVPGSNPGGLTKQDVQRDWDSHGSGRLIKLDGEMRRRITWHLETRTAIAIFPNEVLPTVFKWRDLPRPQDESIIPQTGITRYRDFKPGEHRVQMLWDGDKCETFVDEVQLKMFIMRFVYNIDQRFLIPSEVLADANLVYETGDWVDEWFCLDKNDEIMECPREIYRPDTRRIRFFDQVRREDDRKRVVKRNRDVYYAPQRSSGYEIPARVEIDRLSDEECFYAFKAGGFYEESQQVPAQEQAEEAGTA